MIASLEGKIAAKHRDHVIIVVNGVGYQVFAPHTTIERLDDSEAFLHTMLIVREDSMTLYGFATLSERDLFETLLKVNGVGPKLAIAILGSISVDHLRNAVFSERSEILMRVPGIGKKTAQKIVFELKDKLTGGLDSLPAMAFDDINGDVVDALVALGYSIVEAQTAIQSLPPDAPNTVEDRIRLALQYFG